MLFRSSCPTETGYPYDWRSGSDGSGDSQPASEEPRKAVVDDVCEILGVSKTYAYSLMREYNKELKAKGYIVVSGKISTKFLAEKIYGMKVED